VREWGPYGAAGCAPPDRTHGDGGRGGGRGLVQAGPVAGMGGRSLYWNSAFSGLGERGGGTALLRWSRAPCGLRVLQKDSESGTVALELLF